MTTKPHIKRLGTILLRNSLRLPPSTTPRLRNHLQDNTPARRPNVDTMLLHHDLLQSSFPGTMELPLLPPRNGRMQGTRRRLHLLASTLATILADCPVLRLSQWHSLNMRKTSTRSSAPNTNISILNVTAERRSFFPTSAGSVS